MDSISTRIDFIKKLSKGTDKEIIMNTKSRDLKKKKCNFREIIKQLGGRLEYIKSGSFGHTFKGTVDPNDRDNEDEMSYAVKIVGYPKREIYGKPKDIKRPENAEILMLKVLREFVEKQMTPHITLPIVTFNTSIKPFVKLEEDPDIKDKIIPYAKYKLFVDKYHEGNFHKNASVLVSEWANRGDLHNFIKKKYREKTRLQFVHWQVIFFQILSVLAIIQGKYPAFRHNDLKANNILVQEIKTRKKDPYFIYCINKVIYKVPNIGYIIKLWDFDFATIPGVVDNNKVQAEWTSSHNVKPIQNRYYDVHYFFNTLIHKGFLPKFMTSSLIDNKIKSFIDRILPKKFREGKYVTKKWRIRVNEEYMTPEYILSKDPLFKDFKIDSYHKDFQDTQECVDHFKWSGKND
jgi:serine/threonine protein kinase